VCPTLHLVGNASVRQYGRCERAARLRPSQLSTGTPIPRADPVRDTSPTRRKELSMAMSINDVDTRINHEPDN
jgi:hypothetical protein